MSAHVETERCTDCGATHALADLWGGRDGEGEEQGYRAGDLLCGSCVEARMMAEREEADAA